MLAVVRAPLPAAQALAGPAGKDARTTIPSSSPPGAARPHRGRPSRRGAAPAYDGGWRADRRAPPGVVVMPNAKAVLGRSPLTDPRSVGSSLVFHAVLLVAASLAALSVALPGDPELPHTL